MAAPMKTCTMCMSHIKDRNYRALSSKLSLENYDYAFKCLDFHPREESFACSLCTNKLNRLCKLNDGVDEKLNKMKEEREKLIGILLKNRGEAQEKRTPRARSGLKRLLSKTPTPKGKSKRALFNTPKHRLVPNSAMFSHQKIGKNRDSSTQTIQTSENFDVTAKIAGVDTSKIINEESTKAAIKSILNNRSTTAVMKNFCKNSAYRDAMLHVCCMELKKEIDSVVSKKSDLLKSDIESLTDFNWAFIAGKLRKEAPNLYKLFNEFVTCNSKKESDKLPVIITSLSVLLYGRSRSMNQLQLALGLILDKCGLTKEGLKILHDMGITVASSSIHKQKKKLIKEQEKQISTTMSRYYNTYYPSPENPLSDDLRKYGIEILGDNFDVTITPAKMTMMSQRRSLHWFLTMVKQKRIMAHDVHVSLTTQEERNVLTMPTSAWLPSDEEFISLQENMKFHVKKVLLTYIDFLQPVKKCVPEFINHDFISRTKEKSVILNCDLVEASENTSEGMITILQNVNKLVFQAVGQNQKIKDRIVFGGDVLTNERAFAAQEAMQNAKSDYDMLDGLVHRPEGLHREMNFLLGIYQQFYLESSASDSGSLYKLRNIINRRTVSGPKEVINNFRSHHQFIHDVTDAYIVSAFMDNMNMDMLSQPVNIPVFSLMCDEDKYKWIDNAANDVLDTLGLNSWKAFQDIRLQLSSLSEDDVQIDAMKHGPSFLCAVCGKAYVRKSWLKQHLRVKHKLTFHVASSTIPETPLQTFMKMALIYRDTCDAYSMGDGGRIVRNAKFEWVYAGALHHTKYKIWLWRMITYINAILPPDQAFEYMWNMTVNLKGGIKSNIPNDNCVELQVFNIKRELNTQGANKSFESARNICMTTQVIDKIKEQVMFTSNVAKSSRNRKEVDKSKDILTMVDSLRRKGPVSELSWESFSKYKDPLSKIDIQKLHDWINEQKEIADLYM